MVPSLIESIKSAGLVLVADRSDDNDGSGITGPPSDRDGGGGGRTMPEGVNGILRSDGLLHFSGMIDV